MHLLHLFGHICLAPVSMEISVEISLKGHNSSLSNTPVLLKITHSFLPLPHLSGLPDFNKFYEIFASLVDVLI